FARPSNDRQNRGDSRTLFRNKPSVTMNTSRLSQEQRDQFARAAEERKQEERKRKVEKLHEQAKKREEVLNRAKQIQQEKEQKNQLRISDNQSKVAAANQNKKAQGNNFNNSTTFNNSMNESTTYAKPVAQQYKPVVLDTTSKALNQNKIIKNPANALKKPTATAAAAANAEYTFVVDKTNPLRNDITLPSSSMVQPNLQHKADWTILAASGNIHDELELDTTVTDLTHHSDDGNYGIDDIRSDQDSDNDDEDEARIPNWAKERLFQTFWKTQGHWYLSRRTLKLTRRTFGHYPIIKDELQIWLRDLKSNKTDENKSEAGKESTKTSVEQDVKSFVEAVKEKAAGAFNFVAGGEGEGKGLVGTVKEKAAEAYHYVTEKVTEATHVVTGDSHKEVIKDSSQSSVTDKANEPVNEAEAQ
ncbi:unnamed protein product, partial [Rotaria magnacalcarata]